MSLERWQNIIILTTVLLVLVLGCAPEIRYKLLSTFFDGVPHPDTKVVTAVIDSLLISDSTALFSQTKSNPVFGGSVHPPFQERECNKCHDQNNFSNYIAEKSELCFECHEEGMNTHAFSHGPVVSGNCLACHDPHKSNHERLLVEAGANLCFGCHEASAIANNWIHQDIGGANCTECHAPHYSEMESLLKPMAL